MALSDKQRRILVLVMVGMFVVVLGVPSIRWLADRSAWLCELKGDLWVQPTHGKPYCGDG